MISVAGALRAGLVSLCLLAPGLALAAESHRLDDLAGTVEALLEAYARIGNDTVVDQARDVREAELLLANGRRLLADGKAGDARLPLTQAYQLATDLVINARSGQTVSTRRADQYSTGQAEDRREALVQARIESVRSLTDAYRRVAEEKRLPLSPQLDVVQRGIETARASLLLGRRDEALGQINAVYEKASALAAGARQGDTLVRSLVFDNPAEEYAYERERHASYKMLVKLVADEVAAKPALRDIINQYELEAALLQERADERARVGKHAEAVKMLESASNVLMQAIRASGRFLPG